MRATSTTFTTVKLILSNYKMFLRSRHFKIILLTVSAILLLKRFKANIYNWINGNLIDTTIALGYPLFYNDVNDALEKSKPDFANLVPNAMRASFKKVLGIAEDDNSNQIWWNSIMHRVFFNVEEWISNIEDQMKVEVSKTLNDSKESITLAVIRGAQNHLHLDVNHKIAIRYVYSETWKHWLRMLAEDLLKSILIEVNQEIHVQTVSLIADMKTKLPKWLPQQLTSLLPGELIAPPAYIPSNLIERVWKWILELEVSVLSQIHERIEMEVDLTEKKLCQITEQRLRESIQDKLKITGLNMLEPIEP
eukprot:NODE_31_length_32452_cov_0.352672.p13 type:complete len:307 gc:universal NODE_31_length_32452_cov_0.352672:637-1557(+)